MNRSRELIIFGNGGLASVVKFYTDKIGLKVACFCADGAYLEGDRFESLPNIAFEELARYFPPERYQMFVAIGASDMLGDVREKKMAESRKMGYSLYSYPGSSHLQDRVQIGLNVFVMPGYSVDPFVMFGDGVIAWNGSVISHHTIVDDYSFIAPGAVICGKVNIGRHCFIGSNATIRDNLKIADRTLVGAGAVITHDTELGGVYLPAKTVRIGRSSDTMSFHS